MKKIRAEFKLLTPDDKGIIRVSANFNQNVVAIELLNVSGPVPNKATTKPQPVVMYFVGQDELMKTQPNCGTIPQLYAPTLDVKSGDLGPNYQSQPHLLLKAFEGYYRVDDLYIQCNSEGYDGAGLEDSALLSVIYHYEIK